VPLPAARQTPILEENQGFRAFQLSSHEAPSFWSDANEPSSGRWNYGREMAEKFCRKWRIPRHFWVLLHAVKHDMGQTALLPLRRKVCWGSFRLKNPTASAGFEPANLDTKGQHATSRPPKPLVGWLEARIIYIVLVKQMVFGLFNMCLHVKPCSIRSAEFSTWTCNVKKLFYLRLWILSHLTKCKWGARWPTG
jgi:hypothetical protein